MLRRLLLLKGMKILIDIGHPAHVHLFRHFYREMNTRGHELFVTVKEIAAARKLLGLYGIPFITLGKKSDGVVAKAVNQLLYDWRMLRLVRKEKIEIGIGSSITIAHVSRFSGMKSIMFDDDDDAVEPLMTRFGHPFTGTVVSPDSLRESRRKKDTVFYAGYHELAYLHPSRFTPDADILARAGLSVNDRFFVLRFNAFRAHHDVGAGGLRYQQKKDLVSFLEGYGRVIITTEKDTDPEFKRYQVPVAPDEIHSLMYYSSAFIGDSQTMSAEAAMLGVPSFRCNTFAGRLSSLEELEKRYGLTYAFHPDEFDRLMDKLKELLALPDLRNEWHTRRDEMLKGKIDVTDFMINLVENYPESVKSRKN
jgi:predicted glycosyltransferase